MRRTNTARYKGGDGGAWTVDCSYALIHSRDHHKGPNGRLVCHICHPPAHVIQARRLAAAQGQLQAAA